MSLTGWKVAWEPWPARLSWDGSAGQNCDRLLLESLFWFLSSGYYKCVRMDWSYSRAQLGTTQRGYRNWLHTRACFSKESQPQVLVDNQIPKVWLRTPTKRLWSTLKSVKFCSFQRAHKLGKVEKRSWVGGGVVGFCQLSATIQFPKLLN